MNSLILFLIFFLIGTSLNLYAKNNINSFSAIKCNDQLKEIDLEGPSGPFYEIPHKVQDDLNTCYANTAVNLLIALSPQEYQTSFLDVAVQLKKFKNQLESTLGFGQTCDAINAIKKYKLCPQKITNKNINKEIKILYQFLKLLTETSNLINSSKLDTINFIKSNLSNFLHLDLLTENEKNLITNFRSSSYLKNYYKNSNQSPNNKDQLTSYDFEVILAEKKMTTLIQDQDFIIIQEFELLEMHQFKLDIYRQENIRFINNDFSKSNLKRNWEQTLYLEYFKNNFKLFYDLVQNFKIVDKILPLRKLLNDTLTFNQDLINLSILELYIAPECSEHNPNNQRVSIDENISCHYVKFEKKEPINLDLMRTKIITFLQKNLPVGFESKKHASTIVGTRFNSEKQTCEFKIRDSLFQESFWKSENELFNKIDQLSFVENI